MWKVGKFCYLGEILNTEDAIQQWQQELELHENVPQVPTHINWEWGFH